ncbi:MAG: type VI secretion system baseplate subunit TssG [Limnobacter sp.]|nr:type VI secretion system baseplate subunit TssG [Limnobacter sp.]
MSNLKDASKHFYQLLALLERQHPADPKIGCADTPKREPYRFAYFPSLGFELNDCVQPNPSLLKCRPAHTQPVYFFQHFGLLGPNGALPTHLTEFAIDRIRHHDDHSWSDFLNLFHHRFFELLYRAWTQSKPYANQHQGRNVFFRCLFDLLGDDDLTIAPFQSSHHKHQEGVEKALSHSLGVKVKLKTLVGQWLSIPRDHRYGLSADRARLGRNITLGQRVWCVQSKVCIQVGPLSWGQYSSLQPQAKGLAQFQQRVTKLLGLELDWDYTLIVSGNELPDPLLSRGLQLGRSIWLGRKAHQTTAQVTRPQPPLQSLSTCSAS